MYIDQFIDQDKPIEIALPPKMQLLDPINRSVGRSDIFHLINNKRVIMGFIVLDKMYFIFNNTLIPFDKNIKIHYKPGIFIEKNHSNLWIRDHSQALLLAQNHPHAVDYF